MDRCLPSHDRLGHHPNDGFPGIDAFVLPPGSAAHDHSERTESCRSAFQPQGRKAEVQRSGLCGPATRGPPRHADVNLFVVPGGVPETLSPQGVTSAVDPRLPSASDRINPAWPGGHMGGTTPWFPTTTKAVDSVPSGAFVAGTKTGAPGFRSAALASAKVTTGMLAGSETVLEPVG